MIASVATNVIDTLPLDAQAQAHAQTIAATAAEALREELAQRLFTAFDIFDATNHRFLIGPATQRAEDVERHGEALRRITAMQKPEVLERVGNKITLALPLGAHEHCSWIALGTSETLEEHVALSLAELFVESRTSRSRAAELHDEARRLSEHIGATFEEITLIYRLTQNLSIAHRPQELGRQALEWMEDVVRAEGLAIYFNLAFNEDLLKHDEHHEPIYLTRGAVPVSQADFGALLETLGETDAARPLVLNHGVPEPSRELFPNIRGLVLVPLREGDRLFGWLAAFNHRDGREFGSGEANLLASVGTILGIHSGNIDLYKQQADLFGGVVRAMSSAIDAKDPYTRGHSDRVARVSVRLAEELGCDEPTLRTLYLGGLLHDVGKIGINDDVLRKPGKLTDGEYEHIKTHVEIGYRILRGLKKMGHLLPMVLHHHEAWDGKGYPFGLSGTNIPFLARIVAVADAYDAMASDRPYRKGMEDDKLDAIFRNGSGKQWDPEVVDAFFRARADIRAISQRHPDPVEHVAVEWSH